MDNDEQFLLIHCAFSLPEWIDPNNVENRVYIHKNKLHLIPLVYDVMDDKENSINLVLNNSIDTLAQNNIQILIHDKLKQISNKIYSNPGINYHSSIVVLPKQCADIIHKFPLIISHIVESFVDVRKDNGTKIRKQIKIKHRKFELDHDQYVFVSVRFTRYLYGILTSEPLKNAPMYLGKKNLILINIKIKIN